jgi:NADH dehydrogenase [ubiquinone] 1 alpha subcomplex assembly factor 7
LGTNPDGFLSDDMDDQAPAGSVVEICPEGILLVQDVANLIDRQGGAALFVDYGSDQGSRDSLRGFSRHEQVHFLSRPGQVDITADVDFMALRHAVNHRTNPQVSTGSKTAPSPTIGLQSTSDSVDATASRSGLATAFGPVKQGEFLVAMGIRERVISLLTREDCTEEMGDNLYQALVRLASPEEMGERYKVLGIVAIGPDAVEDRPPGF